MDNLKRLALAEGRKFVVMFFYLWVLLALFALHETVVLAKYQIDYSPFGFALLNAFVLAKVMLVADRLHLGQRFNDRPLIYPILYSSFWFSVVFICFHVVERVGFGLMEGKSFYESVPPLGGGSLAGILSVGVITAVALIPFFALRQLSRVIGADEMYALLLTSGKGSTRPHRSSGA